MVPSPQGTPEHQALERAFRAEGLTWLGVAGPPPPAEAAAARARYDAWLAQGTQGTMDFLVRHAAGKYDPGFALPGARSVLMAGLGYRQEAGVTACGQGRVARYAWGRDYHKVMLAKLRRVTARLEDLWPGERWRAFTDTSPLDERWWAERADAAFTGRHALSINRDLGSWFFLGEVLSTRAFEAPPPRGHLHGSCPSGCRRCHDVCPTGALDAEGRLDARLCIAYLTIEHRGPIDDALKPALGSWLFGCDLCQEVCPFNLKVPLTKEAGFVAWKAGPALDLAEVLGLDDASFTRRFAGSPVHRAGRHRLVRNACLVAANTGQKETLSRMEPLTRDPDPGVADAAAWACRRLGSGAPA